MGGKAPLLRADAAIGYGVEAADEDNNGAAEEEREGEVAEAEEDEGGVVGSPVCVNVNRGAVDRKGVTALSASVPPPPSSSVPPPLLPLLPVLLASCIHAA